MDIRQRIRARAILALFCIAAFILAASLYRTQIMEGASYAIKSNQQYVKPQAALFDRGSIFFESKDGTKAAAASIGNGYLVYMDPKLVADPSQTYEALSQYLKLDKSDFMGKAAKGDLYEELAQKIDETTAESVSGLTLQGIGVVAENWRTYPGGVLAAHEIGIVGKGNGQSIEGRYGLEKMYETTLTRPGIGSSVNIFAQLFSGSRGSALEDGKTEGDIITTIEPVVQNYLETILKQTNDAWHPDEIGGIIMDPHTGEIVAMSSLPTFDPNDLSAVKGPSVFSNPLVENVYEMGSIMKPLTMAAALDSGAVQPDTTYDDTGCIKVQDRKICNFDLHARGVIPMQQILSQSLNVGAATIAMKTGSTTLEKYFKSFGLMEKSGIDLPDEATPIVGNLKAGTNIDVATAAFGQGIAVSPVEMARALSVLANGGYLVTPHLVKEVDRRDGTVEKVDPSPTGPVISPKTASEIKDMLVTVVDKAFLPGTIARTHYSQGAKTGTAQIADPVNGGYYADRYLHSFFGFLPASNAGYLIFLYQVYPKGAEYASQTLTHAYEELAGFLINYYNVAPDR